MKDVNFDVIIIGGGVVGCAIARELSKYKVSIALLEKEDDVGWGASCRNTGVVHAGFSHIPGSLKAKYCVDGNKTYRKMCSELDVPYKKLGKLVVAKNKEQFRNLEILKMQGKKNGVVGLEIIHESDLKKMEPNIEGTGALFSPNSAITSPYLLTIALAENALTNGASFFLNTEVKSITRLSNSHFRIKTNKGEFTSSYVINSAGLYSDKIARMVGENKYRIYPYRGEYYILDKNASWLVNHLIYPAQHQGEKGGWGSHIVPTIDGNILIGPSIQAIKGKENYSNTLSKMRELFREGEIFLPKIFSKYFIRNYAGNRCKLPKKYSQGFYDYIIQESATVHNFINLIGIESPGLTAAQPIAQRVVEMINKKDKLNSSPSFNPFRKGILRFEEQDEETKKFLIKQDPDYGEVVCRCEKVTKKEILEAANNPLGARSLVSIKYRTRAMMGRCQGGYCQTRIMEILKESFKLNPQEITLKGKNSYLLTGYRSNKENKSCQKKKLLSLEEELLV